MPSEEMLGQLIMLWFGRTMRFLGVTVPPLAVLHVLFIVFTDEFLSQHIILTLFLIFLLSLACCMTTLSKVCVLRRRSFAKDYPIDILCDSDLKYDNETEVVPHYKLSYHFMDIGRTLFNLIYKNPVEFCKFRPAYGMFLLTGFVSLAGFVAALKNVKEWDVKDDIFCVALELAIPMIMLIMLMYFMANSGFYFAARDSDLYTPFEQFVQVPMKSVVAKTVAIFLTSGGTHLFLTLFLFFTIALCLVSSNYLYHASVLEGMLKNLLPSIFPDSKKVIRSVLIVMIVMGANALVGMVVVSFLEAKKSIMGIIEKNWQRNLGAISFLLPDTEAETLQDLRNALYLKRNEALTQKEEAAFNYITWPIWRTKQPFMLERFEDDEASDQEVPDNQQQPDEQHEAENNQEPDVDEPEQVKPAAHLGETAQLREEIEPATSEELDEPTMQEELEHQQPSTSTACLKKPTKRKFTPIQA